MAKCSLAGVAGLEVHHPGVPGTPLGKVQGGGDPEVVFPHHFRQMAQHEEIVGQVVQAVLTGQALLQAAQIAGVVRQGRRRQLHEFLLKGRIIEPGGFQGLQVDGAGAQAHATPAAGQGAPVQQGLRRDADHHVGIDEALAGLAIPQAPFLVADEPGTGAG